MIYKLIWIVLGLPKSIYFNLKYFGISGLMLPVVLSPFVFLKKVEGVVQLNEHKTGLIKMGLPSVGIFNEIFSRTIWQVIGCVKFEGKASLGSGSILTKVIKEENVLIVGNPAKIVKRNIQWKE